MPMTGIGISDADDDIAFKNKLHFTHYFNNFLRFFANILESRRISANAIYAILRLYP